MKNLVRDLYLAFILAATLVAHRTDAAAKVRDLNFKSCHCHGNLVVAAGKQAATFPPIC